MIKPLALNGVEQARQNILRTIAFGTLDAVAERPFPTDKGPFRLRQEVLNDGSCCRTLVGTSKAVVDVYYDFPPDTICCTVDRSGTILMGLDGQVSILSPGHVSISYGPQRAHLRFGRGSISRTTIILKQDALRHLLASPKVANRLQKHAGHYSIATSEIEARFGLKSFLELVESVERRDSEMHIAVMTMALTSAPSDPKWPLVDRNLGQGTVFADLVANVLADPGKKWTTPVASELAGYSQFHFSRVFRSEIGIGFKDFVARCRTQIVMWSLLHEDEALEDLAQRCGYGSVTTLREALRDHTGLLPSEFLRMRGTADR